MKKENLLSLTQTAMLSALIIVMTFVPYVGYIVYGGLSITTLHVPVIIGAIVLGPVGGTILGAVWGLTCLIYAAMNGTADAAIFLNPMISVVPRIIVGFATAWYYRWLRKLPGAGVWAIPATAVLGTLTNTALVLGAISVFGTGIIALPSWIKNVIMTAITVNGGVEMLLAVVFVTAAARALIAYNKRKRI